MSKEVPPSNAHAEDQQKAPGSKRNKIIIIGIVSAALLVVIALAIGLGVGLTRHNHAQSESAQSIESASNNSLASTTATISPTPTSSSTSTSSSASVSGKANAACPYNDLSSIGNSLTTPDASNTWWQPALGSTWQIVLSPDGDEPQLNYDYDVYDLDLFDVPASTFADLHAHGKKVICYFSAGSAEDWRSDYPCFTDADKGAGLKGWQGENWLVTNSSNVRAIMLERMNLAVQKGCDGIDPDNVDGYDNKENHLGLTRQDAIDYVSFLADAAHARNLSIGLKNAGGIAPQVLDKMQWEVNEECIELGECAQFDVFTKANKPVFNIEYPPEAHIEDDWTKQEESDRCAQYADASTGATGFSTVLKKYNLDEWILTCPLA